MASHMTAYDGFNLPPELEPLSAWTYVGLSILYAIPVIGWIFLIVFSISDRNLNRRNYSRSYLLCALLVVIAVVALTLTGVGAQWIADIQSGTAQEQVTQVVSNVTGA